MRSWIDSSVVGVVSVVDRDEQYRDVFAAHRVTVFRLAVLLAGDPHVAEEITAEVFARALPRWRGGLIREPLPYLRMAVVNEVRSRHRRRSREQRALARIGTHPDAVREPDRLALADVLIAALMRLPVRQRAVVVLRFHDDLSEVEVGRTLGIAEGTVKSQASRGLAELRTILEDKP